MHRRPSEARTLDRLARQIGLSRSVFAARFQQRVRQPPLQHLTLWRMQLARTRLTSTDLPLARIAERVGCGTEASFSKAFAKIVGTSPGPYRRQAGPGVVNEGQGDFANDARSLSRGGARYPLHAEPPE